MEKWDCKKSQWEQTHLNLKSFCSSDRETQEHRTPAHNFIWSIRSSLNLNDQNNTAGKDLPITNIENRSYLKDLSQFESVMRYVGSKSISTRQYLDKKKTWRWIRKHYGARRLELTWVWENRHTNIHICFLFNNKLSVLASPTHLIGLYSSGAHPYIYISSRADLMFSVTSSKKNMSLRHDNISGANQQPPCAIVQDILIYFT